jgi:choline monooxygenase
MLSMPGMDAAPGFPTAEDDLPRLELASWGPLAFVSLDPYARFDDLVAPFRERLDPLLDRPAELEEASVRHFDVAANWALYVDNYLEGLHIPFVHPELDGTLGGYRLETGPGAALQVGLAASGQPCLPLPAGHADASEPVAAYYLWLFPCTMLNVYPWGLSLNVVTPLAADRTRVTFASFVADEELRGAGAGGALDLVEAQDEAVVESVQRGVRARLYRPGRYAPGHEDCVHHFHRLLADRLSERESPPNQACAGRGAPG